VPRRKRGDSSEPTVGYDAGKKVKGRKRPVVVDTLGLLMGLKVHRGDIQDCVGAKLLLELIKDKYPCVKHLWAGSLYKNGDLVNWVKEHCGWVLESVSKPKDQEGFKVLPHRWIVERTLAWIGKYRRLGKDYEATPVSSEAMIHGAMIHRMVRFLCPRQPARSPPFLYLF
jgi:putative transposase